MHCWAAALKAEVPSDDNWVIKKGKRVGSGRYTCQDYRQEMILLGLQRRLHEPSLSDEERKRVIEEIQKLEDEMQFD